MQDRRIRNVAALTGLLLVAAGGCARSEFNLQRPSWEIEPPTAHHQELPVEPARWPEHATSGRAATGEHQWQGAVPVPNGAHGPAHAQTSPPAVAAYRPQIPPPRSQTPPQAQRAMPKRLPPTNEQAGPKQPGPPSAAMTMNERLPLPRNIDINDNRLDPQLDAAFQRLHQAGTMMPRHVSSATQRQVPPPAARVASPFERPGQQQTGSVR